MKKLALVFLIILFPTILFSQALEITKTANYWDGNLAIIGLIKNNLGNSVSYVNIGLICKNSSGQIVHTDTTYAFSPIGSGQEIPFKFLLSPTDAEGVSNYSVSIDDYTNGGSGTFNFKISQLSITEKNNSFHKYSGEITNTNNKLLKYVNIAFLGFDKNGKLVYFDSTYPSRSSLPANGSSLFEILIPPNISAKIKTYRCFAYAD